VRGIGHRVRSQKPGVRIQEKNKENNTLFYWLLTNN